MAELTTPVRGVLGVTSTPPSGLGQIGYGIVVGSTGVDEDWLIQGGYQGGVWSVTTAGVWTRRSDLDTSLEFNNMPSVRVREGSDGVEGSVWYYSGSQNPTINVDPLPFTLGAFGRARIAGQGLNDDAYPYIQLIPQSGAIGRRFIETVDGYGITTDINFTDPIASYIAGLALSYQASPQRLLIDDGSAYVDGAGRVKVYTASGLSVLPSMTTNALYYVYSDVVDDDAFGVIISDVAPDPPDWANARYFPGDTFSRYLGAFKAKSSTDAYNFRMDGPADAPVVFYLEDTTLSPFRVVSAGTATTTTTVTLGPTGVSMVPPTSQTAIIRVSAGAADVKLIYGATNLYTVKAGSDRVVWMPLSTVQAFGYRNVSAAAVDIDCLGYVDRR